MVWNPGQSLFGDRYFIERKLGEGGIGITYLAKNRRGELRVIKTYKEEIFNNPVWVPHRSKLRQDFCEEALRLALCRHPHVVQVENVFNEGEFPCMAMEYIEGEDLGKLITKKGVLSEDEALLYIRQIGDALTVVHERGLLHRDLKPSNIMMRAGKWEAVLIDFGIARQFIPGTIQEHTNSVSHGFAPPEQYELKAERGEYTDVYALAATLYALLTAQLPMPVPARLQNFTLQAPKDFNASISDNVNQAIMRGMALNYRYRPQSVQKWLDLLGSTTQTWGSNSREIRTISGSAKMNSIAISPDGKTIASGGGEVKLWDLHSGELLRSLKGYGHVTFNPDGQTLATNLSYFDNKIGIWHCLTGELLHTLKWQGYLYYPITISPNGHFIATSRDWTILFNPVIGYRDFPLIGIWNLKTGEFIYEIAGHFGLVNSIAFSPDSQILASGSNDATIKLWSVKTGKLIRTLNENAQEYKFPENYQAILSVAFSPQGNIIASGSRDKIINLWNPITGQLIRTLSGHSELINSLAFSPDGKILATASKDKTIKLWQIDIGNQIYTFSKYSHSVNCITFSPDGQTLASCDDSGNIKIWQRG
ncbi:serine/threonine-protein kinase [Fischerella sp. JS2]|uniref:serine/threonine-protein kinase n=1 Tax=Fischerella sp. JS2 TaxID=2597771 RepID=UPI0028E37D0A|nr:serine/threonine-protein kinase [Fischerella sp. JS2]